MNIVSRFIRNFLLIALISNSFFMISCSQNEEAVTSPVSGGAGGGGPGSGGALSTSCTSGTGGSGNQCADMSLYPRYAMAAVPFSNPTATCLAATPNKPIETLTPTFYYAGVPTYSVAPALPAGVTINSASGMISGMPTGAIENNTLYTITVNTDIGGLYRCDFKYKVFAADTAGTSTSLGAMVATRVGPISALLQNGHVLIVGGTGLRSAEIFNPTTGTFSATGQMARYGASTATILADGTVVIGGGLTTAGGVTAQLALEIYNPTTGVFTAAGVSLARTPTDAILLANGKILFLEGASVCDVNAGTYTSYAAEIYDPVANTVAAAGFSGGKTGTAISNGKILIRGYQACAMNAVTAAFTTISTAAARLFDYTNSSNVATGSSYTFPSTVQGPQPRKGLLKADGNILFADFESNAGVQVFQIYNSTTGVFTSNPKATSYDAGIPLREQTDGSILLVSPGKSLINTYIPTTDTLNYGTAVMIYDHGANGSVTSLANGNILIVGKSDYGEYYKPL